MSAAGSGRAELRAASTMATGRNEQNVAPAKGRETVFSRAMSVLVVTAPCIPVLFLLPLGLVYDLFCWARLRVNLLLRSWRLDRKHEEKVGHVQKQVLEWRAAGAKTPMCTARSQFQSITFQKLTYKDSLHKIVLDLPDIISIDEKLRTVRVEPNVTIGQLNDYLVGRGWTLPVVPELDDLTIGGLVMGGGIETTSHKHGLFQYICKSYELVMADASVVTCSVENWPELFFAIPFSYGTLGFLTAVELKIIPYKPYIKLTYYPVGSARECAELVRRECDDDTIDSVEGLMYSLDSGVVMSGVFLDKCDPRRLNSIGRWYKPWFYKFVESFASEKRKNEDVVTEYIPTLDFFHRHTRSSFWLLEYIIPFGNNVVFRWLFGWMLPPKHAVVKWLKEKFVPGEMLDRFIVQDFGIPVELLPESIEMAAKETAIWPMWICPTRHFMPKGMEHLAYFKRELVSGLQIDLGVYGFCPLPDYDKVSTQRRMERFIIDRGGFVALYAETQLTREEFHEMLSVNMDGYERLRKQLGCEGAFPHVYEKISKLGRK